MTLCKNSRKSSVRFPLKVDHFKVTHMKYIDVYININNRIGSGRGVADCRDIESHIYLFDRVAAVIILQIGATEV